MRPNAAALLAAAALTLGAADLPAHADPWVFKYDEFSDSLNQAVTQIDGGQFYTQPGFVAGEAFGQIYRPAPEMFPLQILGFDLILAAPPNAPDLETYATIEVYVSDSKTPDPGVAPTFSISTRDLFNPATQSLGLPLKGNYAYSIQFDASDEENRPPMITGGNIWLMVRFEEAAQSLSSEWNSLACFEVEGLLCGCQPVGTIHDQRITPNVNVLNHVTPLGTCVGAVDGWTYMEDVPPTQTGFSIDGDVILRLRADVATGPCEPACGDATCGDDGCGGSCGTCTDGTFCVDGGCVSCQPDCLSKQCGDDGCGGTCGTCGGAQTCGADYFCHDDCTRACGGKQCGDDGCGGSCGTCGAGLACDDGRCEAPCAPACDGKDCGPDGCGGACGACGAGLTCVGGLCEAPCAPACAGKTCGDDGCGGTCGTCAGDSTCEAGVCTEPAAAFAISDVSPAQGLAGRPTAVSITGRGFAPGAQVKVGASDCDDVVVTGDGLISATVPALGVGTYSVIVIHPDERVATLANGFQVVPVDLVDPGAESGDSASGCGGAGPAGGFTDLLLGLVGLGAAAALGRGFTRRRAQ